MHLAGFDLMWDAYPHPGGPAEDVKRTIGGGADADWLTNTAVLRISRSFNASGNTIPRLPEGGLTTVVGADGHEYAVRFDEFVAWLRSHYGPPNLVYEYPPPGGGDIPAEFRARQGVIVFEVPGWKDAAGHVDLWNGMRCRNHNYFARASRVSLWDVPDGPSRCGISGSVGLAGRNGAGDVEYVQRLLHERGLNAGALDGVCGRFTIEAIRHFQARFLEHPDGRVDPEGRTIHELRGE